MNDKHRGPSRALRSALSLIFVGLYILGLIAMFTFSFQTGLILWVVSTLGGIGLLYWIHVSDKRNRQDAPAEAPEGDQP